MEQKKPTTHFNIWYFILALLATMWIQEIWVTSREVAHLSYSEFQVQLQQGQVAEASVSENQIRGTLKTPLPDGKRQFVTTRVDPQFAAQLQQHGVNVTGVAESVFSTAMAWLIPLLVFYALWLYLMRRMMNSGPGGGLLSVGKSRAKIYMETDTKVSFNDVAGVDEAKEELKEVVEFLRNPDKYGRLGAHVPKGVLLVGPPGTGKTLLARAVAGEAGVPFFSISGSEFVEMFVGVGAARVRDLFDQASQKAPAIIFIDELDALGRARSAFTVNTNDEKEQTLNQLLVEMDGFDTRQGLVLLAATNRPEILDPALLRAGRFDRQILVDRPDKIGRIQILNVHLRKIKLDKDVSPEKIASLTPGFTGADLANLVNEAALLATRRSADAVGLDDFTLAVERIVAGLEKRNRLLNPFERRVVAFHEMGHAIVSMSLPGVDPVHKVSIIPRGIGALGYNMQRPTEDRFLMAREELENKMAALLGGRAAEQIIFGHLSTGAADDMVKATEIARSMVTRYGMDPNLGGVAYEVDRSPYLGSATPPELNSRQYSEHTAREIDLAVRRLLDTAQVNAVSILEREREKLEKGANLLLEKETLTEDDLLALMSGATQPVQPQKKSDIAAEADDPWQLHYPRCQKP